MSQELTEVATKKTEPDNISWFRKKFPSFFTEKVVANRESGFVLLSPKPRPKRDWVPTNWQPVARKPGTGRTTHVALHVNRDTGSFFFRCPCKDVPLSVTRDALMNALAIGQGHDWVHIEVDTEKFELNRTELRAAIQTLEG